MTFQPLLVAEQRRHPRAQLNLSVRLRWPAPLGQLTEVTETLDICRSGLLIYRHDPCRAEARLWVMFPFDSALPPLQPEIPARVVRVKRTPTGGHLVGMEFEESPRHAGGAGATGFDRRGHERIRLALPVRARPSDSPWPEETMTIDVSAGGVLLCTARLYAVGDTLRMTLPYGRWASGGEVPARVVRVSRSPGSAEQQIALALLTPERP